MTLYLTCAGDPKSFPKIITANRLFFLFWLYLFEGGCSEWDYANFQNLKILKFFFQIPKFSKNSTPPTPKIQKIYYINKSNIPLWSK